MAVDNLDKLPKENNCRFAKPEHFAQACLGLLENEEKKLLEEHADTDDCAECLHLWLEVNQLIDQLKIKELLPLIDALQENKEKTWRRN